jgi:hypothetical protein
MTMTTIRFNTGRGYTSSGQRIVATLHDDGIVTFMDHDRGISGEYWKSDRDSFDAANVMDHYDSGDYTSGRRSWADGMARDGVNALTAYPGN